MIKNKTISQAAISTFRSRGFKRALVTRSACHQLRVAPVILSGAKDLANQSGFQILR